MDFQADALGRSSDIDSVTEREPRRRRPRVALSFVCAMLSHGSSIPRRLRGIAHSAMRSFEYHALDGMFVTLRSSHTCLLLLAEAQPGPKPAIVAPSRVVPLRRARSSRGAHGRARRLRLRCTRKYRRLRKRLEPDQRQVIPASSTGLPGPTAVPFDPIPSTVTRWRRWPTLRRLRAFDLHGYGPLAGATATGPTSG